MSANNDEQDDQKIDKSSKSTENVDDDPAKAQSKTSQSEEQRKPSLKPKLIRRKSIDLESRLNRMYATIFHFA